MTEENNFMKYTKAAKRNEFELFGAFADTKPFDGYFWVENLSNYYLVLFTRGKKILTSLNNTFASSRETYEILVEPALSGRKDHSKSLPARFM